MAALVLLPLLLLSSFHPSASAATSPYGAATTTLRIGVSHAAPTNSFSLADALVVDEARYRASLATAPPAPVVGPARAKKSYAPIASGRQLAAQAPTYVVQAAFGTPQQPLLLALDTSNDAAWIPASACSGCQASSASFSPEKSTSYSPVKCGDAQCRQVPMTPLCFAATATCGFNMSYGASTFQAGLSRDTLTIAGDPFPGYTFGLIQSATGTSLPPQGLLGLGRGALSLVAQTKSMYQGTFSYCLPGFRSASFSGSLKLGPKGQPIRIKTTPLLSNPHRPSLYYVNLVAIRVGRRVVNIPASALAFDPVSGAGTVIDSGTMFTRLVTPAYVAVRDEFRRRIVYAGNVTTLGGFDTCYDGPITPPTITFMFPGMNVTLPPENVMIHSSSGSTSCLALAAAPLNVNGVVNVIANMQQQNHRVLFDLANNRVGFSREACTTTL